MDDARLTVYTTPWCGDCHRVKWFLRSRGIPYREIDISDDPAAAALVRRAARGNLSVPTIVLPDGRVLVEPPLRELLAALSAA